jgi:hypothetical protein
MEQSTREMIEKLRYLQMEQREISRRLVDKILKEPVLKEALREGLVKLGFPSPSGFLRSLRDKQ